MPLRTQLPSRSRLATVLVACLGLLPLSSHVRVANGRTSIASGGTVASFLRGPGDPTRAEIRRRLAEGSADTYIGDILAERDSSLSRWPDREGAPLVVWVQNKSSIPSWSPTFVEAVRDAFLEWDAVDLPVRFTFTEDSLAADVHVTWVDHFDEPISGRTKWARDDAWWITDADIVLAVNHRNGPTLDDDAMHAMTLHEVGHLLGLDHTKDQSSVMAAKVRVRSLSRADRATARLIYTLPPGAVR
jgi:hypothetical protein